MSERLDAFITAVARRPPRDVDPGDRIQAAVALTFARDPESLLIIRRARREGDPWSGHMALPGGRRDPDDDDLLATAVRETREEVGLDLATRKLIGPLDDLAPTISTLPRILVRPFVFLLERPALLRLSDEVADAAWVGLDELLSPSVWGNHDVEARGVRFTRPGYRLPHGIVWGMTERILTPVLDLLRVESQPPVDF